MQALLLVISMTFSKMTIFLSLSLTESKDNITWTSDGDLTMVCKLQNFKVKVYQLSWTTWAAPGYKQGVRRERYSSHVLEGLVARCPLQQIMKSICEHSHRTHCSSDDLWPYKTWIKRSQILLLDFLPHVPYIQLHTASLQTKWKWDSTNSHSLTQFYKAF